MNYDQYIKKKNQESNYQQNELPSCRSASSGENLKC